MLPAISGAASFVAANISGWLKGTIRPTTPNGSRRVKSTLPAPGVGIVSPRRAGASPAKKRNCSTATPKSPRMTPIGLPLSIVSIHASSSPWDWISPASRSTYLARSAGAIARHPGNAPCAASTARSTSNAPPSGICAITSPVAGLTVAIVAPLSAATRAPPISIRQSRTTYVFGG